MGKLPILQFLWAMSASRRLLSTVSPASAAAVPAAVESSSAVLAEEEEEGMQEKKNRERGKHLYRWLSELGGAPEGAVSRTLDKWVREGRPVSAMDLIKHVKGLRKYRRYEHALEVMDWMVNIKGMKISYGDHAIRLYLIAKVKGVKSAEDYFTNLPESAKNQLTYGALLSCYCSEKMEDDAVTLYEKMKELKLVSGTLVHNHLMTLYTKLGQPEKVPTILEEMKANNVAPDNVTYCILMNSYASLNDIESVERVINQLEDTGEVLPHWSSYSTLASIYNSAGLFEKSESALKKLEQLIDGSDKEPFHFLVSLYAGAGNLQEVHRVWKSLKATFTKQTNIGYLIMLQALNKLDDIDGLKACYEEWESVFTFYDARLTNFAIGAHLRHGMVEEAESLVRKAKEKGGAYDFRTCDMFMDYYLKNNEIAAALNWLEAAVQIAKEAEWKLDDEKVEMFMKYYGKGKCVDGAEKFCKALEGLGSLGAGAYESLLRTYVASGRRGDPSLRRRIEEDKVELVPTIQDLLDVVCGSK
ncbi:pentatricopeptide repeat-containing protein-like, mitochondrial [Iris pallida]|uniref:Pentatricopeptide repeat-containing protein-like, mitochondrial n=1 Tax=Iris pallida TaxID=29817 RepID=A0AAX6I371_IRIPA|nr:pentatricopeptide repeat-containing protein-like, mitochondrial [Iris pallida]